MITNGMTSGNKPGIDATKKLPGEDFKRPGRLVAPKRKRRRVIEMDVAVKTKINKFSPLQ